MSAPCLASIEAFEGASVGEAADAVLGVAFPEGRRARWTMQPESVVDDTMLSVIPGVRGGGFTASPAVLTARMVTAEALQKLEQCGLVLRIWSDSGASTFQLTRKGEHHLAAS